MLCSLIQLYNLERFIVIDYFVSLFINSWLCYLKWRSLDYAVRKPQAFQPQFYLSSLSMEPSWYVLRWLTCELASSTVWCVLVNTKHQQFILPLNLSSTYKGITTSKYINTLHIASGLVLEFQATPPEKGAGPARLKYQWERSYANLVSHI